MNTVILMGRLARDVDFHEAKDENSSAFARYTLAVDRRYKKEGQQDADFISCVTFGKNAEFASKYLHKGSKIVVEGHLQTGSYTNKDGQKVYTTDVAVHSQEFAESKKADNPTAQPAPEAAEDNDVPDFMTMPAEDEDELPFR